MVKSNINLLKSNVVWPWLGATAKDPNVGADDTPNL